MPNLLSFSDDGTQFAWDATSITLAEECLRKYGLKMIEGWSKNSATRNVHLKFGGHYASALEHYHKHRALGMGHDEAMELVVEEALIETWDHEWIELTDEEVAQADEEKQALLGPGAAPATKSFRMVGTGSPWNSGDNLKTRENLIRTIVWYLEQFKDSGTKVLTLANGKPAAELSFSLDLDNGLVLCGHLDSLVEYAGDPYVMDQKTTKSTPGPYYFENYNPDIQMSTYTFAGKAIYKIPVKGVIIDAAQIAVGFSRFERGFTFRTDAQLTEWYDQSMLTIEAARKATRENFFPMNRTSCGNYGGCEFREICSRSPEVRPQFLKGGFVKGERWDPLARR